MDRLNKGIQQKQVEKTGYKPVQNFMWQFLHNKLGILIRLKTVEFCDDLGAVESTVSFLIRAHLIMVHKNFIS